VPEGTKWVTQEALATFNTAITAAETVKNNVDATQAEVDAAKTTLTNATSAFKAVIKDGTKPGIAGADKTALTAAISDANTAKTSIVVNTDAANVPEGTKWVTQEALDTFNTAITAAETVKNNVDATEAEVAAATTALTNATSAFNAAIKPGTKPGSSGGGGGGGNDVPPTTGTAPVPINFWQDAGAADGAILTSSDNVLLTTDDDFIAAVTGDYTNVQWYVDGVSAPGTTTTSITISGAAYSDALGIHRLSVTVIKAGAYYSKEITFTVTE
jgi:hypothetical protein